MEKRRNFTLNFLFMLPIILRPPFKKRVIQEGAGGGGAYSAVAATFDGTNDYMTRGAGLTGAVDGKKTIISVWMLLNSGDNNTIVILHNTDGRVQILKASNNKIQIYNSSPSDALVWSCYSTTTVMANSGWHHIIASIDMAIPGSGHMFIDDLTSYSEITATDNVFDFTVSNWGMAATIGGALKLNGCISELYFNTVDYLDFSVEANRRKFIDASGAPVNLGTDGSTPTGNVPIIYLKNPYDSFGTNSGSGGNFSVTGALAECADPPP